MKNEFWVNLPVKDLKRSKDFFTKIGFGIKKVPGNSDNILWLDADKNHVIINMFEVQRFKEANRKNKKAIEVLFNIGAENKEKVNEFAEKVKNAGGEMYREPIEKDGWMYGFGFTDLDGHRWSILYMDLSKIPNC